MPFSTPRNTPLDYKTKVSSTDTTGNYLLNKLIAGSNISITQNNIGGNETLTFATTGIVSSQWVTTGSDIYYTTGNVMIGVTTTTSKLHVVGVQPANASTSANFGINLIGGQGGTSTSGQLGGSNGGGMVITGGLGGASISSGTGAAKYGGTGGGLTFTSGAGNNGGAYTAVGTGGVGGAGGAINFYTGNGGNGGNTASGTGGAGGSPGLATFGGGTGGSGGQGGSGGDGGAGGAGGTVQILGGNGGSGGMGGGTGHGGNGGNVYITGGNAGSSSSQSGDGGSVYLTAGLQGSGGSGSHGGHIIIDTASAGDSGKIYIGAGNAYTVIVGTNYTSVGFGGQNSPAYAVDVSGDVNITGSFRINGTPISSGSPGGSNNDLQYNSSGSFAGLTPSTGFLYWNGSSYSWTTPGGGSPGGSNGDIQYNNSGSFAGITGYNSGGGGTPYNISITQGIITGASFASPASDNTYSFPTSITIQGGIITAIS